MPLYTTPNPNPNPSPNPNPDQLNGSAYSASSMPRTATIRYDAPASAEAAVRTMDGTRLRSHTLKVSSQGIVLAPN